MQFAVIGLGVFGKTAAFELQRLGNDVMGIDIDAKEVDAVSDRISHAVIADATDKATLEELNISKCDGVLVSIGDYLEANLLCTLNVINLDIKNVWVKAKTDAHHAILSRLGVGQIIHPEQDMGIRIAQAMNYPMVRQYMALGDEQFLVKIKASSSMVGKPIGVLLKNHPNVRLFLVKRDHMLFDKVDDNFVVSHHDRLVFAGSLAELKPLANAFKF